MPATVLACVDLSLMPVGPGSNPLVVGSKSFRAYDQTGGNLRSVCAVPRESSVSRSSTGTRMCATSSTSKLRHVAIDTARLRPLGDDVVQVAPARDNTGKAVQGTASPLSFVGALACNLRPSRGAFQASQSMLIAPACTKSTRRSIEMDRLPYDSAVSG
jgi:hypothetical protein